MLKIKQHERNNMRMLRIHVDGLKRMVGIRGGLGAIRETNPMVANSILVNIYFQLRMNTLTDNSQDVCCSYL